MNRDEIDALSARHSLMAAVDAVTRAGDQLATMVAGLVGAMWHARAVGLDEGEVLDAAALLVEPPELARVVQFGDETRVEQFVRRVVSDRGERDDS